MNYNRKKLRKHWNLSEYELKKLLLQLQKQWSRKYSKLKLLRDLNKRPILNN